LITEQDEVVVGIAEVVIGAIEKTRERLVSRGGGENLTTIEGVLVTCTEGSVPSEIIDLATT
jgi:hypothetical protein